MKAFLTAILLALLLACGDGEPQEVRVVKDPQRIVSLSPFVTEILFALGVGDRIVGATQYCIYPEAARKIPRVGDQKPNYEKVIALKPDLIFANAGQAHRPILAKFRRAGIQAVAAPTASFSEGRQSILMIGRRVNRLAEAERLVGKTDTEFAQVRAQTKSLKKVRILVVSWDYSKITALGKGTTADRLITAAGGENVVTSGANRGYIRAFQRERAVALAPDVIVFLAGQGITDKAVTKAKAFWKSAESIPAVRNGRIHLIPSELFNPMSPRLGQGLRELAEYLHPGALEHPESANR